MIDDATTSIALYFVLLILIGVYAMKKSTSGISGWILIGITGAVSGIVVGAITVLAWANVPVLESGAAFSSVFYELLTSFVASSLAIIWVSLKTQQATKKAINWFDETHAKVSAS